MSPEGGLSLKQAIRNSLESRASRPKITDALKELRANDVLRPKIAKGVADAIQGQASKQGITGYGFGVLKNTASEGIEEALDSYLSVALDAYLNLSPDAQQKLHTKGHWSEVIGAGVLGAMMGATSSGVLVRTSKENKEIAKYARDAVNEATLKKLKGNVEGINQFAEDPEATVRLTGLYGDKAPEYVKINDVLKGNDVNKIVETIAKFGEQVIGSDVLTPNTRPPAQQIPKETTPATQTPSIVNDATPAEFDSLAKDSEYKAPDGTSWIRKDGEMANPVMVGTDSDGKSVEMTTVEFADFVNSQPRESDASVANETLTSISNRTKGDTAAFDAAISQRKKAAVRLARSLKIGDTVTTENGDIFVVDSKVKEDGTALTYGVDSNKARLKDENGVDIPAGSTNLANELLSSQVSQNGKFVDVAAGSITRKAVTPTKSKEEQKKNQPLKQTKLLQLQILMDLKLM